MMKKTALLGVAIVSMLCLASLAFAVFPDTKVTRSIEGQCMSDVIVTLSMDLGTEPQDSFFMLNDSASAPQIRDPIPNFAIPALTRFTYPSAWYDNDMLINVHRSIRNVGFYAWRNAVPGTQYSFQYRLEPGQEGIVRFDGQFMSGGMNAPGIISGKNEVTIGPTDEVCDYQDNDCNGIEDDAWREALDNPDGCVYTDEDHGQCEYDGHFECNSADPTGPAVCMPNDPLPDILEDETGYCEDGIDNDCDGYADWDDSDCGYIVVGSVSDDEDTPNPIEGARVLAINTEDADLNTETRSGPDGSYHLGLDTGGLALPDFTTFNIIVSKLTYAPGFASVDAAAPTEPRLPGESDATIDFILGPEVTSCRADCSVPPTDTCNRECEGWAGCTFAPPDDDEMLQDILTVMDKCHGKQPGFEVFWDSGADNANGTDDDNYITCCSGPIDLREQLGRTSFSDIGNIVVMTKPALLDGRQVLVKIVLYREE